jgi:DNA-binding MarR family transcriptional regulator
VRITPDRIDRRSKLVQLTRRGETKLEDSRAAWKLAQDRFEAAFGVKDAADLRRTLDVIASLEFPDAPAATAS